MGAGGIAEGILGPGGTLQCYEARDADCTGWRIVENGSEDIASAISRRNASV